MRNAGDRRSVLGELSHELRALHQQLIAATQKEFEKLHGRVQGPGALLQLLVDDPLFAWLRPLSRAIAALDELADSEDGDPAAIDEVLSSIVRLLDEPGEFRATYLVYLQADPDVVMAHAALRRLLPPRPRDS